METILLVEDEIVIALGTSMMLEDAGYTVHVAPDGQAGLDQALKVEPDLIMTDMMMPRMNGLAMIDELRRRGVTVPIIIATSISEESLRKGDGGSYDAYLGKPYREGPLLALVRQLLDGHASEETNGS
ncbi:response regulator transcription factor [Sandarakinorhabdus sp. DWP1-3-1]|uniref:response regulator transcription factor n=1 Tax=Sandarakinorhabdus sp. DWP1-3-1 TaxID=2804627 RepID=UPI003CF317CC